MVVAQEEVERVAEAREVALEEVERVVEVKEEAPVAVVREEEAMVVAQEELERVAAMAAILTVVVALGGLLCCFAFQVCDGHQQVWV